MIEVGYTLIMLLKVFFCFSIVYIIIPRQVIRFDQDCNGATDKFFITLVHSNFFAIVIIHFLAFLKIYETFSILVSYLVVIFGAKEFRSRVMSKQSYLSQSKLIPKLFDFFDENRSFKEKIQIRLKSKMVDILAKIKLRIKNLFLYPMRGIIVIVVLSAAAFIRFRDSIFNPTYTEWDPYLHLVWTKYLGQNQIYHDGIYPFGYQAVMSGIVKTTFIDPYWLCRFLGPLASILICLSIYYFSLKVTRNHAASLISLVVYGMVTSDLFPSVFARQTAALSQEYAIVFILPGLYFLWLYFRNKKVHYLLLFAEALAITVLIHPYVAVYFALWAGILFITSILFVKLSFNTIKKFLLVSIISVVVGTMPLVIGWLMGISFIEAGTDFVMEGIFTGTEKLSVSVLLQNIITNNPFFNFGILAFALVLLGLILRKFVDRTSLFVTVFICSFVMYMFYRGPELGLPSFTIPYRTGSFLSVILCILFACSFESFERIVFLWNQNAFRRFRTITVNLIALIICVYIVYYYPPGDYKKNTLEYDGAVMSYLEIKKNFPAFNWTIIAPTEQLQEVLGFGWHYELLRFVQKYTPEELEDPKFNMPIETNDIFYYTEKIPLYLGRAVTAEDSEMSLEPEGNDPFKQFYHTAKQRGIIQAKAIKLIEAYMKSHKGVDVFYEDKYMKIYHIHNESKK